MTEQEYLDLAQDALGICSDYLVSAENVTTPSGNRPEYDILHVLVNSLAQAIVDHRTCGAEYNLEELEDNDES